MKPPIILNTMQKSSPQTGHVRCEHLGNASKGNQPWFCSLVEEPIGVTVLGYPAKSQRCELSHGCMFSAIRHVVVKVVKGEEFVITGPNVLDIVNRKRDDLASRWPNEVFKVVPADD